MGNSVGHAEGRIEVLDFFNYYSCFPFTGSDGTQQGSSHFCMLRALPICV